jgi:diketogulonate reductase-like aldo/keto reductase
LNDSVVADIAKKHGKSNANVLINWSIQSGHSCIPKSSNSERIKINFETVQLTEQDMTALNELTTTNPTRYVNPIDFFNIDVFGKSGSKI